MPRCTTALRSDEWHGTPWCGFTWPDRLSHFMLLSTTTFILRFCHKSRACTNWRAMLDRTTKWHATLFTLHWRHCFIYLFLITAPVPSSHAGAREWFPTLAGFAINDRVFKGGRLVVYGSYAPEVSLFFEGTPSLLASLWHLVVRVIKLQLRSWVDLPYGEPYFATRTFLTIQFGLALHTRTRGACTQLASL